MAGLADEGAPALARFLEQFPGSERAQALHLALRALRARVEPDQVLMCELAWEIHRHGYWSQLCRDDGSPYDCEETYFREVLGLSSWRTAYKRFAIGRMLSGFAEPARPVIRAAVAQIGVAKATVIVPAVERSGDWQRWTDLAQQVAYPVLQARVSAALAALPRGPEASPPGERFRRAVLSAMPDIEAMEVVERFFDVGAMIVGTAHPVAIFLAGCRESLAEWEVQAAHGPRATERAPHRHDENEAPLGHRKDLHPKELGAHRKVCPRGQTNPVRQWVGGRMKRRTRIGARARRRILAGGPRATGRRAASLEEWAAIREFVLARARWTCQACGMRRRLDVHHVIKRSQGGSDFDLNRLVALCRSCHEQTDAPYVHGRLVVTPRGLGAFQFALVRRADKGTRPDRMEGAGTLVGNADAPSAGLGTPMQSANVGNAT